MPPATDGSAGRVPWASGGVHQAGAAHKGRQRATHKWNEFKRDGGRSKSRSSKEFAVKVSREMVVEVNGGRGKEEIFFLG